MRRRDKSPNHPTVYPARYEMRWLRRRPQRILVRVLLVVVAFAAFVWPLAWPGALVVAVVAGLTHYLYVWQRHRVATSWHREAYAERRSVHTLLPLTRHGYVLLPDRHLGEERVQNLLVGPTGVWFVHAVGRSPQLRVWGDAAFLHPEDQPGPPGPADLVAFARRLGEALTGAYGEQVRVRPVAIVIGDDTPEELENTNDLPVVPAREFGDFIRAQAHGEPAGASRDRLVAAAETALSAEKPTPGENPGLPPMAVKKSLWSKRTGLEFRRETEISGPTPDSPTDDEEEEREK